MKHYYLKIFCKPYVPLILLFLGMGTYSAHAQLESSLDECDSVPRVQKLKYSGVRFSGYTRTWFFHRYLQADYELGDVGRLTNPRNISLGDGYDQPILHIQMEASPFTATKLSSEIAFDNRILRGGAFNNTVDDNGRMAAPWYLFNFTSETYTNFGSFKITAGGGVNWFRLSPFTMGSANDYNTRDDMFERLPWEGQGNDFDRYMAYYQRGDTPREQRQGTSATQGVIVEASGLPGGLNASFLVGKASGSGGFQSYNTKKPMNMVGGRLEKIISSHSLAVNYMNQFGYEKNVITYTPIIRNADTLYVDDLRMSQMGTTLEAKLQLTERIKLNTEIGAGSYLSSGYNEGIKDNHKAGLANVNTYKRTWEELLFAEVNISDFPLRFQAYRVGVNYVNFASTVQNTSIEQSSDTEGQNLANTACYTGLLPTIGQITNNKQGITLFFNKKVGNLKVKAGYANSQELVNLAGDLRNGGPRAQILAKSQDSLTLASYTNTITFQHTLNNLARSRFGFWERYVGPYNRIHNNFRRSYEIISITDTVVDYKKSFVSFDLELKYKTIVLNRPVIFVNYTQFSSVHDKLTLLPRAYPITILTNEKSLPDTNTFFQLFYNEFTVFYNVQRRITLVGLFGYEAALANMRTELADADGNLITDAHGRIIYSSKGKPMHQVDFGYGIGLDYNFHDRASLHVRQRWYNHKDYNFTKDKFAGNELTVELKMFF